MVPALPVHSLFPNQSWVSSEFREVTLFHAVTGRPQASSFLGLCHAPEPHPGDGGGKGWRAQGCGCRGKPSTWKGAHPFTHLHWLKLSHRAQPAATEGGEGLLVDNWQSLLHLQQVGLKSFA